MGSSEFIKRNFGVGYHLSVSPLDQASSTIEAFHQQKHIINECIQSSVPTAKVNPQTTQDVISFILPFKEQDSFSNLFLKLEKIAESLPIHVKAKPKKIKNKIK